MVVQKNFDGSVMLAPRDPQGRLVPGGRLINSREIVRTPEMVKAYAEELRKEEAKQSGRRFEFPRFMLTP